MLYLNHDTRFEVMDKLQALCALYTCFGSELACRENAALLRKELCFESEASLEATEKKGALRSNMAEYVLVSILQLSLPGGLLR